MCECVRENGAGGEGKGKANRVGALLVFELDAAREPGREQGCHGLGGFDR